MLMKSSDQGSVVVKCEDKKEALREFIVQHLASNVSTAGAGRDQRILLVARSMTSPAAQSLVALGARLAAAGVVVKALFIVNERDPAVRDWAASSADMPFAREVRVARNNRLLDAHEQMVLDASTAWIGDSMRRDPAKRDAYERFSRDCAETARLAALSFHRLWAGAEPLAGVVPSTTLAAPKSAGSDHAVATADMAAAAPADQSDAPTVSTRH